MTEPVQMRIEQRGAAWVVLPEAGDRVLGTHKTKAEAEAQLRAIEASKARAFAAFSAGVHVDGRVRSGVWDRVCVPGEDYKDGQSTEFTPETLLEMAGNFEERGEAVPLDHNHQSNHAARNGQPAPALAFYGALAVVFGGRVLKIACARDCQATGGEPGLDLAQDGLWALRSKVTPLGHELLPNFGYLSPTFTPEGTRRDGTKIGYQLMAVAATNTPWQAGTSITMAVSQVIPWQGTAASADALRMAEATSDEGLKAIVRDKWNRAPDIVSAALTVLHRRGFGTEVMDTPSSPPLVPPPVSEYTRDQQGAPRMKLSKNLARFVRMDDAAGDTDEKQVKEALAARMADEGKAALAGDGKFPYAARASALEEAAAEAEALGADGDGEKPAVSLRNLAAKFRKLAAPTEAACPTCGKAPCVCPATQAATMEARVEQARRESARAVAGRLGIPMAEGMTSAQMFDTIRATTVPSADIPRLVDARVAEALAAREAEQAKALTKDKAGRLVQMAVKGGYPGDAADALRVASDPACYATMEAAFQPYLNRAAQDPALFEQQTQAGAPRGADPRRQAAALDRRVYKSEIGTIVEDGGAMAAEAIRLADSRDPIIMDKVDRLMQRGDRADPGMRALAAERLLKTERPDLVQAFDALATHIPGTL